MKYRHHTGVRLSLISGHATFVGPNWRALHERYHHEALSKGCECDQSTIRTRELAPPVTGPNAVTPLNEAELIRAGFERMLARNGEDDFTFDGIPNLEVLAVECGFNIDRQTALQVWNQMVDEAVALQAEAEQADSQLADVLEAGDGSGTGTSAAADVQVATVVEVSDVVADPAAVSDVPPADAPKAAEEVAPKEAAPAKAATGKAATTTATASTGRARGGNRGQIE